MSWGVDDRNVFGADAGFAYTGNQRYATDEQWREAALRAAEDAMHKEQEVALLRQETNLLHAAMLEVRREIAELKAMVQQLWYAPNMPGYELGKQQFINDGGAP